MYLRLTTDSGESTIVKLDDDFGSCVKLEALGDDFEPLNSRNDVAVYFPGYGIENSYGDAWLMVNDESVGHANLLNDDGQAVL